MKVLSSCLPIFCSKCRRRDIIVEPLLKEQVLQAHGAYGATYGGAFVMSGGRAGQGEVWNGGLSEEAYGTSVFGGEREVSWLSVLEK